MSKPLGTPLSGKCGMPRQIKEIPLEYVMVKTQVKFIQGEVLTVIDASFNDAVQRKAVKDLINRFFSDNLNWLYDLSHPDVQSLGDREMVQVDVEETLKGK